MALRLLRCAIEETPGWHVNLFVEPHVVSFVAVAGQYSPSPALFDVECDNVVSRWPGKASECRLEVSWQDDTAEKAARPRATMPAGPAGGPAAGAPGLDHGDRRHPRGAP